MAKFNYSIATHSHTSRNTTTVTEKRAPTDESVTLLKGMEEAALNKVLASVSLDPNALSAKVIISQSALGFSRDAIVLYEVNGERIEVKLELPGPGATRRAAVDALKAGIAMSITHRLLDSACEDPRFVESIGHLWPERG